LACGRVRQKYKVILVEEHNCKTGSLALTTSLLPGKVREKKKRGIVGYDRER